MPRRARACPECGADERAGWDEEATRYDDLDLPEAAFEDSEAGKSSGDKPKAMAGRMPVFWCVVAVLVLCAMVYFAFKSVF